MIDYSVTKYQAARALATYALKSTVDAYLTYSEIDDYAKKDLLDSYLTASDLPDGYISFSYNELNPDYTSGTETTLTLSFIPADPNALYVYKNGLLMRRVTALTDGYQEYTLSNNVITFLSDNIAGSWFSAQYIDSYNVTAVNKEFIQLSDVIPSSYSGYDGYVVAVNSGRNGLEFIAPPTDGINVSTKSLASSFTLAGSQPWTDVSNGGSDALTITFTAVAGETVKAVTKATWRENDTQTYAVLRLRYALDGTGIDSSSQVYSSPDTNNTGCFAQLEHYFTNLSAGSHTIKVQARTNTYGIQIDANFGGEVEVPTLTLVRYKGGYIWRELLQDSMTAYAGGGQTNATQITGTSARVTTCATHLNSVKLPSTPNQGSIYTVFNAGAKDCAVFPYSGGAIDSLGTNNAYYLSAGSTQRFLAFSTTQWRTLEHGQRFVNLTGSEINLTETDLSIQDGNYYDYSLTSLLPPSVYARQRLLYCRASVLHATLGRSFTVRQADGSGPSLIAYTPGNAGSFYAFGNITTTTAGSIEYRWSSSGCTGGVAIVGYWVEG